MINTEINTRTSLTLPKELKAQLEILAKDDKRSMNNLIVTVLDKYVQNELSSDYKKNME